MYNMYVRKYYCIHIIYHYFIKYTNDDKWDFIWTSNPLWNEGKHVKTGDTK